MSKSLIQIFIKQLINNIYQAVGVQVEEPDAGGGDDDEMEEDIAEDVEEEETFQGNRK